MSSVQAALACWDALSWFVRSRMRTGPLETPSFYRYATCSLKVCVRWVSERNLVEMIERSSGAIWWPPAEPVQTLCVSSAKQTATATTTMTTTTKKKWLVLSDKLKQVSKFTWVLREKSTSEQRNCLLDKDDLETLLLVEWVEKKKTKKKKEKSNESHRAIERAKHESLVVGAKNWLFLLLFALFACWLVGCVQVFAGLETVKPICLKSIASTTDAFL